MRTHIGFTLTAMMSCLASAMPATSQDSWLDIEAETIDLQHTLHGQDLVYKGGSCISFGLVKTAIPG